MGVPLCWPFGKLRGLSRRFQRRAGKVADDPWKLATGERLAPMRRTINHCARGPQFPERFASSMLAACSGVKRKDCAKQSFLAGVLGG
jgi:hypothetical protein